MVAARKHKVREVNEMEYYKSGKGTAEICKAVGARMHGWSMGAICNAIQVGSGKEGSPRRSVAVGNKLHWEHSWNGRSLHPARRVPVPNVRTKANH